MSSCSDIVAILSDNKKAKVIGTETGGGFTGNTNGMMPVTQIPGQMEITIPLQKYTTAVTPPTDHGHGSISDVQVNPTLLQWMADEDVVMKETIKLIRNNWSISP
ncbi:MAG: C-terminal processing protease CtpA/Prc [Cyclobacteriaceae bacterium]|jgi:C-terminal processing protease CtpA/Prc